MIERPCPISAGLMTFAFLFCAVTEGEKSEDAPGDSEEGKGPVEATKDAAASAANAAQARTHLPALSYALQTCFTTSSRIMRTHMPFR